MDCITGRMGNAQSRKSPIETESGWGAAAGFYPKINYWLEILIISGKFASYSKLSFPSKL
jgi:hypothetical protein